MCCVTVLLTGVTMTTQVLFPMIDAIHVSKFGRHATLSSS